MHNKEWSDPVWRRWATARCVAQQEKKKEEENG